MVLPTVLPTMINWWHRQTRVPAAVAKFVLEDGFKPEKAWRLHLKLTQSEVAARVGVNRSAYYNLENSEKPWKASRLKIAVALDTAKSQLDF